jgi:hypothetical protein
MTCSDSINAVVMRNLVQTVPAANAGSVTGKVRLVLTELNQQTIFVLGTDNVSHSFKFPPNPIAFQTELIRAMDHAYDVYVVYSVAKGDNVITNVHVVAPT